MGGAKRLAAIWFLRVGIATAILTGIGILADHGNAIAAELSAGLASSTGAVLTGTM